MRTPVFSKCWRPSRHAEIRLRSHRRPQRRRHPGAQPMVLIGAIAAGALAGTMLAPANGSALAALDASAKLVEGARTTPKTSRLPMAAAASPARSATAPAPDACMPSPAVPVHAGPIAYV